MSGPADQTRRAASDQLRPRGADRDTPPPAIRYTRRAIFAAAPSSITGGVQGAASRIKIRLIGSIWSSLRAPALLGLLRAGGRRRVIPDCRQMQRRVQITPGV